MIAALPLVTSALSLLGPSQTAGAPSSVGAAAWATAGDSFSSMLASFSNDVTNKMKTSEAMSISGIQGKATTQSVVESVVQAQEALQTALAVRDKTVAAFQEVARMAI